MSLLERRGANRWRPVSGASSLGWPRSDISGIGWSERPVSGRPGIGWMWRPSAWSNVLRVVGRHRHPPAGAISGSPRGYPEGKGAWARTFDQPSPMTVGESRQQDTGVPSGERACPRARCGPVAKSRHGGRSVERHFSDYPARHSLSARHPFGCFRRRFETGGRGRKEMMTRSGTARGNEEVRPTLIRSFLRKQESSRRFGRCRRWKAERALPAPHVSRQMSAGLPLARE